ncbi:prolipoprotein diacylglyceryl transferase [Candidatus Gracilibacteria bacterium]|nr:prolipoprotein diacylglyceryl transferase [Candidatus Gracilibacteria bacterium]
MVIILSFFFLAKKGFDKNKLIILAIFSSFLAIIGARLFHYFLHKDSYAKNPDLLFNLDFQGQAVIGGLIGAFLGVYIISKLLKIDYWKILDSVAPFAGIGLIIGRIGCLLAGCCFGKETDLLIGITFPLFSPVHKYQLSQNLGSIFYSHPVHPTQIYEMIAGLLIFLIGIFILKKTKKDGIAILVVILIYLVFRLIDNYFRAPALAYSVPDWFYPSFYLVLIGIIGFGLLKKLKSRKELKIENGELKIIKK